MAFFKFRKDMDDADNASAQSLSMAAIRQRAKYRLVGAAVLVGVGVVSLPLLLEGQPRPVAVNTPIEIPDKNKMPALVIPAASAPAVVAASAPPPKASPAVPIITELADPPPKAKEFKENKAVAPVPIAQAATKKIAVEATKPAVKPASTVVKPVLQVIKPVVAAAPAVPAVVVAPPVAAQAKASEAARAKAILEGIDPPTAAPGRFIVQIGAFSDAARAQEVRMKVEHAGLKTYTHVAETSDGRRIRVRVGPFANRDEAEKAAAKIKKLDLPAALLTL